MKNNPQIIRRTSISATLRVAAAAITLNASAFGQAYYEQRFNDATGLELNNGAAIGPAGSGVSGKPDDKSYTADVSTVPEGQSAPLAHLTSGPEALSADEVTVTLWYKPRTEMNDAATLFRAFAGQLMWEGRRREWVMRLDAWPEDDSKKNANWFFSGKVLGMDMTDQWTFLAFVWRKEGNSSQFVIGSSTSAEHGRQENRPVLLGSVAERTPENRTIGNESIGKMLRPFDGSIDNLRVFSKALDEESIEKIRAADVANTPVVLP